MYEQDWCQVQQCQFYKSKKHSKNVLITSIRKALYPQTLGAKLLRKYLREVRDPRDPLLHRTLCTCVNRVQLTNTCRGFCGGVENAAYIYQVLVAVLDRVAASAKRDGNMKMRCFLCSRQLTLRFSFRRAHSKCMNNSTESVR